MRRNEKSPMVIGRVFTTVTEQRDEGGIPLKPTQIVTSKEVEEQMKGQELEQCISAMQKHMAVQDALLEELVSKFDIILRRMERTEEAAATATQDVQQWQIMHEPTGERV